MTLEEIIEGCRRGNAEARRELYVRYGSPMYGVIRRYVSDASTAEDLLHDGFVTLYTRIGDYRGDGPFEGWCRRIFVNTVMSYFRRRNPLEGADEVSAANLRSSVPPTVLDELSAGEIKEYEYAEIAEMLGISEATTRSQYLRARMKLIEILGRRLHTGTPPRKTDGRGAGR